MDGSQRIDRADLTALALSGADWERILSAIQSYGYRIVARARHKRIEAADADRRLDALRRLSAIIADHVGAPDNKRFR